MVRGNQYLEFADHEIAWDDDPRPQRPRTHAARRIERQHDSGFGWLFWLIALIALTAAVVAAIPRSASATARADTGVARRSDTPQAAVPQAPQTIRETLRPPVFGLQLTTPDGRTYLVYTRRGAILSGKLPPELKLARASTALRVYDAPEANLVWRAPQGTRFLVTTHVCAPPCWRWMTTLEGEHAGFICVPDRSQAAAPPTSPPARPSAPAETSGAAESPPDFPRKNWRDRAEYDLAAGIRQEQDPDRKLGLLRVWQRRYPTTDFEEDRQRLLREALAAGEGPALPNADSSGAARPGRQSP